ncbi:ABC-type polar amino acid transport system ATPase subunit [Bradyrhizobium sp. LB8.2]
MTLDLSRGLTVAIIGRSGSGKSTLLRCIAGLETIQAGKIEICGHEVGRPGKAAQAHLRHDVGMVFSRLQPIPASHSGAEYHVGADLGEKAAKGRGSPTCRRA